MKSENGNLQVPINYNHIIQALLLSWINDKEYREFIHNEGYKYENKNYKLFTFSKLYGLYRYNKNDQKIIFNGDVTLIVSCVEDIFMQYLINTCILSNMPIKILNQQVIIKSVSIVNEKIHQGNISFLSPCTVYSTIYNNGKKQTYYYEPIEKEFSDLIKQNLISKYKAYYGQEPSDSSFSIKLLNEKSYKKIITKYKDSYIIIAYDGCFQITGSMELIKIGYDSGLGSKNSQGFGEFKFI